MQSKTAALSRDGRFQGVYESDLGGLPSPHTPLTDGDLAVKPGKGTPTDVDGVGSSDKMI